MGQLSREVGCNGRRSEPSMVSFMKVRCEQSHEGDEELGQAGI